VIHLDETSFTTTHFIQEISELLAQYVEEINFELDIAANIYSHFGT